jgi:pyruvate dehydrogenase E2 component (dihydrolipoamide acetyltransferase)
MSTTSSTATSTTPRTGGAGASLRGRKQRMMGLRKIIAQRMVQSLQVSAQLTTVVEVDLTAVAELRSRTKADFEAREGVKLSFLPFLAKAALEALRQHPQVNASIDPTDSEITYHDAEHLGVAVDTEKGLYVPVIRNAGEMSIAELSRQIADVAARTRAGKITPEEMAGGTFTITNTGSRGALFDTPIINQPQVAILGTGAVVRRPAAVRDQSGKESIEIRSLVYLALTYDHRLVDGADAARFLSTMKERLEAGNFAAELRG